MRTHRPLSEEQYGTTWIPSGLSAPWISTTLVRLHTMQVKARSAKQKLQLGNNTVC